MNIKKRLAIEPHDHTVGDMQREIDELRGALFLAEQNSPERNILLKLTSALRGDWEEVSHLSVVVGMVLEAETLLHPQSLVATLAVIVRALDGKDEGEGTLWDEQLEAVRRTILARNAELNAVHEDLGKAVERVSFLEAAQRRKG